MSEGLMIYDLLLSLIIIIINLLSDLCPGSRRSGRPCVYQMFSHRHRYSKVPRHFLHPSPNFCGGQKV